MRLLRSRRPGGGRDAVADAYEEWRDLDEDEVGAILAALEQKNRPRMTFVNTARTRGC